MPMNTDKKQKQGGKQVGKNKKEFSCRRRLRLPMRPHGINYQHISHQEQSPNTAEEEDVAHCLVMLSSSTVGHVLLINNEKILPSPPNATIPRRTFPCGWCDKVFPSHQALGGHRASHKKVKGCFAAKIEIKSPENTKLGNMPLSIAPLAENWPRQLPKKKSTKLHVCLECNRQFPSGQALGGHKRSHSAAAAAAAAAATVNPMIAAAAASTTHTLNLLRLFSDSNPIIDLNMPVPTDDIRSDKDNEKEKESMENLEEEVESKEVNMASRSDLMVGSDEEDGSSEWLQIGFGSMFHKQSGADRS